MIKISPSILSADLANLESEIKLLEKYNADMVHIDVMDGVFVPNITFGQPIVKSIKKISDIILDVHLMIQNPEKYIEDFALNGADIISFHPESTDKTPISIIKQIKSYSKKAGIVININSNINILNKEILDNIDLILVMTVNPGSGGQKMIKEQLKKLAEIKEKIKTKPKIILSVDGGINDKTFKEAINAGANCLVSGSYIFSQPNKNYSEPIKLLKNINLE